MVSNEVLRTLIAEIIRDHPPLKDKELYFQLTVLVKRKHQSYWRQFKNGHGFQKMFDSVPPSVEDVNQVREELLFDWALLKKEKKD